MRRKPPQDSRHAIRHVCVEGVVAAQRQNIVFLGKRNFDMDVDFLASYDGPLAGSPCFHIVPKRDVAIAQKAQQDFGKISEETEYVIRLLKGDSHPMFPEEERRYIAQSIRYVHQALVSSGTGWMDAEPGIDLIKPDAYVVNEDGAQVVEDIVITKVTTRI